MATPPTPQPRPAKRIGRKRRAAGWTLLALGLLVAAVWGASGWWTYAYVCPRYTFNVGFGVFDFGLGPSLDKVHAASQASFVKSFNDPLLEYPTSSSLPDAAFSPILGERPRLVFMRFEYVRLPSGVRGLSMSFWPLPLLLWTTGGLALWSGRRARQRAITGLCTKCGYSLAGLPAGSPCPECGKGAGTK